MKAENSRFSLKQRGGAVPVDFYCICKRMKLGRPSFFLTIVMNKELIKNNFTDSSQYVP